jgi:hypothetical protein
VGSARPRHDDDRRAPPEASERSWKWGYPAPPASAGGAPARASGGANAPDTWISLAKRINAVMTRRRRQKRKGQVFADRYHVRAIDSVRGTRNALCYILNNWRHHPRSARGPRLVDGKLDPYSSAILFAGWKEKTVPEIHIPPDYETPCVRAPTTWFLKTGWKLAKPISCFEVPGPRST